MSCLCVCPSSVVCVERKRFAVLRVGKQTKTRFVRTYACLRETHTPTGKSMAFSCLLFIARMARHQQQALKKTWTWTILTLQAPKLKEGHTCFILVVFQCFCFPSRWKRMPFSSFDARRGILIAKPSANASQAGFSPRCTQVGVSPYLRTRGYWNSHNPRLPVVWRWRFGLRGRGNPLRPAEVQHPGLLLSF